MKKLLLGFLVFLLLAVIGSYYFQETIHRGTTDQEFILLIRITNDGSLERYTLALADDAGQVYKDFANSRFGGNSYQVNIYTKQLIVQSADRSQVLKTIPIDPVGKEMMIINIDLAKGTVTDNISLLEYVPGMLASLGFLEYVLILLILLAVYLAFVILPLILIAMILTTILEIFARVKRQFAGSWFNFIVGCGFILLYYPAIMRIFENQDKGFLFYYFITIFLAGYPLYFIAYRVFNKAEVVAARKELNWKIWEQTVNYEYTETTYSDGSKSSDIVSSGIISFLATIVIFILKAILLPLSTYYIGLFTYLLPLLNGEMAWKKRGKVAARKQKAPQKETVYESGVTANHAIPSYDIGSIIYAKYSGDNYYYLATIDEKTPKGVKVTFFDNVTEIVQGNDFRHINYAVTHMKPQGNWKNAGLYYPCIIHNQAEGLYQVTYTEDGVTEWVTPSQLRFNL